MNVRGETWQEIADDVGWQRRTVRSAFERMIGDPSTAEIRESLASAVEFIRDLTLRHGDSWTAPERNEAAAIWYHSQRLLDAQRNEHFDGSSAMGEVVDESRYVWHGVRARVFTTTGTLRFYPSMPWRFEIECSTRGTIRFVGVPNYCTSKRSAVARAMARCRWVANGTYDQRYSRST
jgi:hypothetical protein